MKFIQLENASIDILTVKSCFLENNTLVVRYKDNQIDKIDYGSKESADKNLNLLQKSLNNLGQIRAIRL
jgi:hypothetical protein